MKCKRYGIMGTVQKLNRKVVDRDKLDTPNKPRQRRTEHRFMWKSQWTSQHGTKNVKTLNKTTHKTKKMSNMDPTTKPGMNSGAREG
jgi:hypothetical protein